MVTLVFCCPVQRIANFCFGAWPSLVSICLFSSAGLRVAWILQLMPAKAADGGSLEGDLLYDAVAVCSLHGQLCSYHLPLTYNCERCFAGSD